MIFAGQLTEVLDFYHIVEEQSASGFKHTEEKHYMTRKAERTKNKETYLVDAGELFHNVLLSFRLRWIPELLETDIVEYQHLRYRVISINQFPRDRETLITIQKIND